MNQLSIRKNNLQTKKKKKGFTLVELIIVIAIIAILAAIAIPKFGTIKGDANKKTDIATAKNIATLVTNEIASDNLDMTIAKTSITSLVKKGSKTNEPVDIKAQLDGKKTTSTGNEFYISITDGNVSIFDGSSGDQLFPQG